MSQYFATAKSRKNYNNWFKFDKNWRPGKVIIYTREEFLKVLENENKIREKRYNHGS